MINDLWYKNAVIYCLSVETFMDANGDGVGDFQGLMRRLDYLSGLGVTAIWLMPFQASPGRDDGYDVSDYYNVDPRYGSLGDFVEFTHGAKQRGIRVLIDLVINHTSRDHPWFQDARSDPRSHYRDWYVWSEKSPRMPIRAWSFPASRRQPGPMTTRRKPTIFIVSTITSPISIPLIPRCRRKSSRSWASGSSSASPVSGWMPPPSSSRPKVPTSSSLSSSSIC